MSAKLVRFCDGCGNIIKHGERYHVLCSRCRTHDDKNTGDVHNDGLVEAMMESMDLKRSALANSTELCSKCYKDVTHHIWSLDPENLERLRKEESEKWIKMQEESEKGDE